MKVSKNTQPLCGNFKAQFDVSFSWFLNHDIKVIKKMWRRLAKPGEAEKVRGEVY